MSINNISEVNKMSKVEMVNTPEAIRSVIANIGTKATAYKATVSSAVLSAVQHYRAHGDYTLLQEAMDTVFEINYRDYSAVVKFVQDLTWVGLTMANRGRRQHYEIVGDMVDALVKPANATVKDWGEKTKRVREQMTTRVGLFDAFANGKGIPMKNPDWTTGMPKDQKQSDVIYEGDIFKWHDDVKWLRNDGTGGAGTGSEPALRTLSQEQSQKLAAGFEDKILNSLNKPVVSTVIHILERFEGEREVFATDEELEELQSTVNLFIQRTKARSEIKREREAAAAAEAANANEQAITPPSEQTEA